VADGASTELRPVCIAGDLADIAALLIDTANHRLSENELIHWFKQRTE
jgi:hypothetical protein